MPETTNPSLSEETVRQALQQVKFPGYSRDIISFGLVKSIVIGGTNDVAVTLQVTTRDAAVPSQLERDVRAALAAQAGIGRVEVEVITAQPAAPAPAPGVGGSGQPSAPPRVPGVKRIVAVASGKGGVGKSTVAVNLACALDQLEQRVGVMDADIYGPSVPKMMGSARKPTITDDKLDPVDQFGLKVMSMALLLDENAPVIWRGPMIMKAIQQFSLAVNWGALDVLVVDLPPGTGDAQLSLTQTLALDGGVIVTTPQDVALDVARRGMAMFEKVNVPILGIIENMSYYVCPHCHERDEIFGHGGARREAERMAVPFLGEIPLVTGIRVGGDNGEPIVVADRDGDVARAYRACAQAVLNQLQS